MVTSYPITDWLWSIISFSFWASPSSATWCTNTTLPTRRAHRAVNPWYIQVTRVQSCYNNALLIMPWTFIQHSCLINYRRWGNASNSPTFLALREPNQRGVYTQHVTDLPAAVKGVWSDRFPQRSGGNKRRCRICIWMSNVEVQSPQRRAAPTCSVFGSSTSLRFTGALGWTVSGFASTAAELFLFSFLLLSWDW